MTHAPVPKPWVMAIAPYVPGRATTDDGRAVVKLSSNENPLGTSDTVRNAFRAHSDDLERYPDASATALREALAAKHNLDPARIIYGTGSDEVLHMAAGAFAGPGDAVIHVRYGFSVYEIATRRVGATPVVVDDRDYATDVDAILTAVTPATTLIFVANPNNPTGTHIGRGEMARLHGALRPDIMLVIDQAYAEYLDPEDDDGGLDLARVHANVMITRTFSKIYGLAAERIGWGYASSEAVDAMHRIRAPFNITTAGQRAAIAALHDDDFVSLSKTHNATWQAWLSAELSRLGNFGLRVVPSKANFILVDFLGPVSAETAYHALMAQGYITRWLPGQGLPNSLRISIGTENQTRGFATALQAIVGGDAG